MRICVYGLWHLGTVTAACLAAQNGFEVVGLDADETRIAQLRRGEPPLYEPGLAELLQAGRLNFTSDLHAVSNAEIVWVTFDTPVDEDDQGDVGWVQGQVERTFPYLAAGSTVLVSSQVPVGFTRSLEARYMEQFPDQRVSFACSPENLRLGSAIRAFTQPDRVVIGVRHPDDQAILGRLFAPFTDRIEWMNVESAEMTKHAINAFLALSITFTNEIARLCEQVGADAAEVERGLRSEARIGAKAYVKPGGAFSGGTLARDVAFLGALADSRDVPIPVLSAVPVSNGAHKLWAFHRATELLGTLHGVTIAVLGLTYKPNTDTLRRSSAVELCREFSRAGAHVQAYDPLVKALPDELRDMIDLKSSWRDAVTGAQAVVVATEWAEFREIDPAAFAPDTLILDANRWLAGAAGVHYYTVGKP